MQNCKLIEKLGKRNQEENPTLGNHEKHFLTLGTLHQVSNNLTGDNYCGIWVRSSHDVTWPATKGIGAALMIGWNDLWCCVMPAHKEIIPVPPSLLQFQSQKAIWLDWDREVTLTDYLSTIHSSEFCSEIGHMDKKCFESQGFAGYNLSPRRCHRVHNHSLINSSLVNELSPYSVDFQESVQCPAEDRSNQADSRTWTWLLPQMWHWPVAAEKVIGTWIFKVGSRRTLTNPSCNGLSILPHHKHGPCLGSIMGVGNSINFGVACASGSFFSLHSRAILTWRTWSIDISFTHLLS